MELIFKHGNYRKISKLSDIQNLNGAVRLFVSLVRSCLIRVFIFCPELSVPKLRIITVLSTKFKYTVLLQLHWTLLNEEYKKSLNTSRCFELCFFFQTLKFFIFFHENHYIHIFRLQLRPFLLTKFPAKLKILRSST